MENSSSCYIYGAGKYGKALGQYFLARGDGRFRGFIVSHAAGDTCLGMPVLDVTAFHDVEADVYIAIQQEAVVCTVRMALLAKGVALAHIFDASSFIEQNLQPKARFCNLCGRYADAFTPSGIAAEIFQHHHIIGGGYRENVICPHCGSGDRQRWLYAVLASRTDIFDSDCRVLHFAPEPQIAEAIQQRNPRCQYLSCDLAPGRAMWQVDMTDIPFPDATFDYVIANHVLEHIPDLPKAVSELCRVLKPSGWLVLSFPICMDMDTYEDPAVQTDAERLAAYGQEDHVRLFGRDYKGRLERLGLSVETVSPEGNHLSQEDIQTMGFIEDDIVLLAKDGRR